MHLEKAIQNNLPLYFCCSLIEMKTKIQFFFIRYENVNKPSFYKEDIFFSIVKPLYLCRQQIKQCQLDKQSRHFNFAFLLLKTNQIPIALFLKTIM